MHMRRLTLPLIVMLLLAMAPLSGCLSFDDYDGDGIYDEDDPDDDNDGIPDKWESRNGLNSKNETDAKLDLDGDGLTNLDEYKNGTDPNADDTDNDGIPDGWEVEYGVDATNATNAGLDDDGDGLTTLGEYWNSTDPGNPDSDNDTISDGYEVEHGMMPLDPLDANLDMDLDGLRGTDEFLAQTDPNDPDTDGDGMPDGWEVEWGTDPLVDDADGNPDGDGWDADRDLELEASEALTNLQEYWNGTDPGNGDTDGDGMGDGYETYYGLDPNDGEDAAEDPDEDGLNNHKEHMAGTSPVDADTDGDGMDDWYERRWGLNPLSDVDADADLDGDAFTNLEEYIAGSNISNPDTDGDGVLDGHDVAPLKNVAINITIIQIGVSHDHMIEGAIDNPMVGRPYELYFRISVAGIEVWSETFVTSDEDPNLNLTIQVDIPDDLWEVSITISFWENDTAESSGLNADDHLDVDGVSGELDCDITYDLILGTWKGDTTDGVTDGKADGLPTDPDHPDGAVLFDIKVVPV